MSSMDRVEGSYLAPSLEQAVVSDAMRPQVLSCPPDSSLRTVAQMMAAEHVHCMVVADAGGRGKGTESWGIVSDMDLLRVAREDIDERTASWAAVSEFLSVAPDQPLAHAVQRMVEHDASHLVVIDPVTDRAVGVISTLDVAGVLAWGRA
jgi:CBS domain-containing protein